ncbi:hypothetical protein BURK2_00350 [Burkholderiales bacterium]|nr:hypothetical protein BURK2_00350 [Burkholderiales bacterium]
MSSTKLGLIDYAKKVLPALLLLWHSCALSGPLSPRTIIEFENTNLGHYLLVADAAEIQWIEQGGAGPGWRRTQESFWEESVLAWRLAFACRFYGSVSPGPNSHFFTIDQAECDWLKNLAASLPPDVPKWNYEGDAFKVIPLWEGQCPITERGTATAPVYRLYNRGFERGIDSNHRYTTSRQIVEEMKARGWVEEGIAWCTRPNGPWT